MEPMEPRPGDPSPVDRRVVVSIAVAGLLVLGMVIGAVLVLSSDGGDDREVSVPTSRGTPSTVSSTTSTSRPAPTTTTTARATTTSAATVPPTQIVPLPTTTPTGAQPTSPSTAAPSTSGSTTSTTSAADRQAALLQERLLAEPGLGPSNRGVPSAARFAVRYTPRQSVLVVWAIDNGVAPLPRGAAACSGAPTTSTSSTSPAPTSSSSSSTSSSTAASSTTSSTGGPSTTSTTVDPTRLSTRDRARFEAAEILGVVRSRIESGQLRVRTVRLVGTYPLNGTSDTTVVDATYTRARVLGSIDRATVFARPPVDTLTCLDPQFA